MTVDSTPTSPRSRRALLAGALGGFGAITAAALGRKQTVRADAGDPVIIGALNTGGDTRIETNEEHTALFLNSGAIGLNVFGGEGAVWARSVGETALRGISENNFGVWATSQHHHAVFGHSTSDDPGRARGVWGKSRHGQAIYGDSESGWAGYFDGRVFMSRYVDIAEGPTPVRPTANRARLFVRENANNHTQLCVRFPNGNVRVIATA